jgi:hypothetical protein
MVFELRHGFRVDTRTEVARVFTISKLAWIRDRRSRYRTQVRKPQRQMLERETH